MFFEEQCFLCSFGVKSVLFQGMCLINCAKASSHTQCASFHFETKVIVSNWTGIGRGHLIFGNWICGGNAAPTAVHQKCNKRAIKCGGFSAKFWRHLVCKNELFVCFVSAFGREKSAERSNVVGKNKKKIDLMGSEFDS